MADSKSDLYGLAARLARDIEQLTEVRDTVKKSKVANYEVSYTAWYGTIAPKLDFNLSKAAMLKGLDSTISEKKKRLTKLNQELLQEV